MANKKGITPIIEDVVGSVSITEDIITDAIQEMVKEEIKNYIRQKLEENPELKKEIKDAIKIYLEAKAKEVYATMKLAKAGAKLGLKLMPENLKAEFTKEVVSLFEKELSDVIEKAL